MLTKKKRKIHRDSESCEFVTAAAARNSKGTTSEIVEMPVREKQAETGFNLAAALDAIQARAEENREDDEKFQSGMRTAIGGLIDPNSPPQRIERARRSEASLLEEVAMVSQAEESPLKQNRLYSLLNRLSEVLAEQGRYAEAIEVCPEAPRRGYYARVLEAINRDDSEACNCPVERFAGKNRQTVDVKPETPIAEVVALDGTVKRLYLCKCGFMNVR